MPLSLLLPTLPPDTAVLLVLLPAGFSPAPAATAPTDAWLQALQRRLGASIRVLKVEAAIHPLVVLSFGLGLLPACVLLHRGVELWRHEGLPEEENLVLILLGKVQSARLGKGPR